MRNIHDCVLKLCDLHEEWKREVKNAHVALADPEDKTK